MRVCPLILMIFIAMSFCQCNVQDDDPNVPPDSADDTAEDTSDDSADSDCVDEDNDGWCAEEDCNDHQPFVNPGRTEDCADDLDNDCNGYTDEEDPFCKDVEKSD